MSIRFVMVCNSSHVESYFMSAVVEIPNILVDKPASNQQGNSTRHQLLCISHNLMSSNYVTSESQKLWGKSRQYCYSLKQFVVYLPKLDEVYKKGFSFYDFV